MAKMISRLHAEESLRTANVLRVAGAAAGVIGATSRKVAQEALDDYQRLVKGLEAQMLGTVGLDVDGQGRPILRSSDDIRQWFMVEGGLTV